KGGHDVLLRNRVMRRSTAGSPARALATFGGASASVLPVRPKQTANIFCVVRAMRNQRQHSGMRAASNPELYKRRLKAAIRKRSRGGAPAAPAAYRQQIRSALCHDRRRSFALAFAYAIACTGRNANCNESRHYCD